MNFQFISRNNWINIVAFGILIAFLCPLFFFQKDSYIRIHDYLDGDFIFRHILRESGLMFETDPMHLVPNIMNGLPRGCLSSFLNIEMCIIWLLGSFWGHVVNETIVKIIAFVGMYLLLKKHFLPEDKNHVVVAFTALFFAMIPAFSYTGLAQFGLPLLLFAFLNLRQSKPAFYNFGIIALYAFYSFFVYAGLFAFLALALFGTWDLLRTRKLNVWYFGGLALMVTLYAGIEYQLLDMLFFEKDFHSHRAEFKVLATLNEKGVIVVSFLNLLMGKYHSGNYPGFVFVSVGFAGLVFALWSDKANFKILLVLFLLACTAAFFTTIWDWNRLTPLYEKVAFFRMVNLRRFHYLLPTLVLLFFAKGISQFSGTRYFLFGCFFLFVFLTGWMWKANSAFNIYRSDYSGFSKNATYELTFRQYFARNTFLQIRDYIGKPQSEYRVVSLGFQPSVALYNGFFTLDAYHNNFRLEVRQNFTRMQEKEFKKSKIPLEDGNRCFLVSSEIEDSTAKDFHIKKWEIDTGILREMNCNYIFSAYQIDNSEELGLSLLKSFDGTTEFPKVYLYSL